MTFAEIKRQLSVEEHEKATTGDPLLNLDDTTPSTFMSIALDIEEAQCVRIYISIFLSLAFTH